MAPRRGGSSSGGSGGSGGSGISACTYCNEPLELDGSDWKSSKTNGLFAIEIIIVIVLVVCLVLSSRFKWVRERGTDKLRKAGYAFAVVCTIIYYIFGLVDTGLHEADTETTYWYYLTYIFSGIFWRLSELFILAIILRTISESGRMRSLNTGNIIVVTLLALVSAAGYGLYVANEARIIANGDYSFYSSYDGYDTVQKSYWHVSLAYQVFYMVISILALIAGLLSMIKERSKQALIMIAFVLPSLFLRSLMGVLFYASYDAELYSHTSLSFHALNDISWANSFIYDLMNGAVFLGVAIIGILHPANTGVLQHKSYGTVPQSQMAYDNQPEVYAPAGYENPEMASANQPHIIR